MTLEHSNHRPLPDLLDPRAGDLALRLMRDVAGSERDPAGREATLLARALRYATEIEARLAAQEVRLQHLECLSHTDELTGLLNRRGFALLLERVLDSARRYGEIGVVIYGDLDRFKAVNDAHGHACGDEVLRAAARVLASSVRSIDVAGRLGGDEFALCLVQTTLKDGQRRAAGLQWLLDHTTIGCHGATFSLAATLGLEPYGANDAVEDLMARADMAMYENKRRKYQRAVPLAAE